MSVNWWVVIHMSAPMSVPDRVAVRLAEEGCQRLANLGAALAMAGCACASFTLGGHYSDDLWNGDRKNPWSPGCVRPAPGFEAGGAKGRGGV